MKPTYLLVKSTFTDQNYPRHAHDGYSISLVLEGLHRFVVEGEEVEANEGTVRVVHPFEMHETWMSTWVHMNLSIPTTQIEVRAHLMDIEVPVVFHRLIHDPHLNDMISNLHNTTDTAKNDRLILALIDYLLLHHTYETPEAKRSTSHDPVLQQARAYLHAHADSPEIDLDAVAREAHMSKYHFLRRFKQTFERTPHQYLQNLRIDCVRMKLAQKISLAEAALSCGFYDQSHMIKTYKKFYGHTPKEVK